MGKQSGNGVFTDRDGLTRAGVWGKGRRVRWVDSIDPKSFSTVEEASEDVN